MLEFDNGPYGHATMSYCPLLMKNHNFNDILSLNRVILIITVSTAGTSVSIRHISTVFIFASVILNFLFLAAL